MLLHSCRRKQRLSAALLSLLVSACAPLAWTRPDTTPEQTRLDASDCQQRAWQEAQWRAFSTPAYRGRWRGSLLNDPFFDETYLVRFCMEARGYRLESAGSR